MQEDLSRAGVRHIPELQLAYYKCVGLNKELSQLLNMEPGGGILLSTECGVLTIRPKESDPRIVLARFDGRTPSTDDEYKLVVETVDAFREQMEAR
jgi:hypothetical protein